MSHPTNSINDTDKTKENTLDLREFLDQVVKAISEELMHCDSVGIFLPEAGGTFRGYVGKPYAINGITLDQVVINPNQDLFYREIIETRKLIFIPDTSVDHRPDQRAIQMFNIKSILAMPLCFEDEIYGLVSLFISGKPMNLTVKQIQSIEAYVNMAAVAVRNAKLFTQKQALLQEKQRQLLSSREESAKAQERFQKVFNYNPVAMSIISKQGIYIDVNHSWEVLFQKKRAEVVGTTAKDSILIAKDDIKWNKYRGNLATDIRNLEVSFSLGEDKKRELLFTREVIELGGEQCLLNVFNDVTEMRHLKQEITRFDRLNLIAQMSAGIAHEIRNPMTTVRGFLQLLKENEEFNKTKTYFDIMIDELDRANRIISEFLSLKGEEKDYVFELKNINDILDIIFPLIVADAFTSKVYVEFEKGDIPQLPLNEKEIRQLIYNLVRNGKEAIASTGVVKIKTYQANNEVVLEVEDNGKGIPPHLLDKIENPFFTTKDNGTGLGLSICSSIAQRHNATLDIKSNSSGTRVKVIFKIVK